MNNDELQPIPFYTYKEVMVMLACGKSKAYKICKTINEHYHVEGLFPGRVFKTHFDEYIKFSC